MKKTLFLIFMMIFISSMRLMGQEQQHQPSRYVVGDETQMKLPVNVLGLVRKPGQYIVPFRTGLISVIAYAGGFAENAKINSVKIIRSAQTTNKNKNQARVFTVNVKKYFEEGDISQVPELMPDDTIIVSGTAGAAINKVFIFFRAILPVAQLIFIIDRTARN